MWFDCSFTGMILTTFVKTVQTNKLR